MSWHIDKEYDITKSKYSMAELLHKFREEAIPRLENEAGVKVLPQGSYKYALTHPEIMEGWLEITSISFRVQIKFRGGYFRTRFLKTLVGSQLNKYIRPYL